IETALGGNIQNIVTDDENTAKKMIQYLKQNRLGRATFLPLTSITKPQEFKNPESLTEKGVIGMADELVDIDKKYQNVAKAMLGRIVVVDNVDNAVKIARKYDYGIRMVTLEGELLVPGGAISGGAFKNNSNLLGRRRESEELTKSVKKLLATVDAVNQEIADTKARRNKLRMNLETLKAELQRKSIAQNTARLNIAQARERMEEEQEGAQSLRAEEQEIEGRITEIEHGKEDIQKELSDSETLEKTTQEEILNFQKEVEERRVRESEAAAQVAEWDLKVGKMLQTQSFHQTNVDRIDGELERFQLELEEILQTLEDNAGAVEQKQEQIIEIQKTIAASHDAQNESEQKLKEDIARKEELSVSQKNFFKSREELSERMTSLDKEVYRLNAQKEKLEESVTAQINYMWDEYEITLSDAAGMRDENMTDLSAMKRDVAALKEQIKRLG
ncbi:MAG: chromosome segregation protein SMC, partial [Acetatifactor sp.]|nr:chromosome segregation protein SMC [Acetatifactor sp.]